MKFLLRKNKMKNLQDGNFCQNKNKLHKNYV